MVSSVRGFRDQPPNRDDDSGTITRCFQQLCEGDREGARRLWDHFFPRLQALARRSLQGLPQRVADADDAVQSAFVSFWRRAEQGDYAGELSRGNLWSLLAVITVHKAKRAVRRELAQKRGGGRVRGESEMPGGDSSEFRLDATFGELSGQDFDLVCEELLSRLDDEIRGMAVLRMMSYTNAEVASIFQCSVRRVERKLQLVRLIWQEELQAD